MRNWHAERVASTAPSRGTVFIRPRPRCARSGLGLSLLVLGLMACRRETPGTGIGVVAAPTPEAAQAGVLIMEAGGNAIDAAVAISFALGVTEPAMSGLGGQTQILVAVPGADPVVINGTSFAPAAVPDDATADEITGYRATTVPSAVRALDYAWRHYGSGRIPWADLLTPAIRYAERGFVPGPFREKVWRDFAPQLARNPAAREFFLLEGDETPGRRTFRQPVLAGTLRRLAARGADDFYQGGIAREIAADMEANGGWLSLADLQGVPEPAVLPALATTYRGFTVYSAPPPAGGWVVLRILNLLERDRVEALDPAGGTRALRIAESLRAGHRERRDAPIGDLKEYEAAVEARLAKSRARDLGEGDGQTTHFSVVDGGGMVVAVTASINYGFGAKVANASLGFLYNDYMREFVLERRGHPFALRAGAMPYSSMSPTVVTRNGRAVLALGSPGSARIISAVAQVSELWMDGFARIDEAVAMPRVHVVPDNALELEDPVTADSAALLRAGFVIQPPRAGWVSGALDAHFGGVHAVAWERGEWTGAADPRRDGVVRRTRDLTRVR